MNFNIYYTSDTHGNLFPTDNGSMMQCAREFKKDVNTLFIDGGDTIQGSPLLRYLWDTDQFSQVIPKFYNQIGYDYYTLGNHEFNYGYDRLSTFIQAMEATCICANVTDKRGKLAIKNYVIHTLENGLRIGITGIVTDFINTCEAKENIADFIISDPLEAVKDIFPIIKEQSDITVCIYHGGLEKDLSTGVPYNDSTENVGCKITEELGFDILLTGHQHASHENLNLHGSHVVQPPSNGRKYAKVKWNDGLITSTLYVPEMFMEIMPDFVEVERASQQWLEKQVGSITSEITETRKIELAIHGSQIANLINAAQLEATGADISCASLHNVPITMKKEITVNDILKIAPYTNEILVKEIKGEDLLKTVKRCGTYFKKQGEAIQVAYEFQTPKEQHYNYDHLANVEYNIELGPDESANIVSEILIKGQPLELDKVYTMAMSDYRSAGIGGYEHYVEAKTLKKCSSDMQTILFDFIENHQEYHIAKLSKINFIL